MYSNNYDSLMWALITTFEEMVGNNWQDIMYISMVSVGKPYAIYFITLFLVGHIILNCLFCAILISLFNVGKISTIVADHVYPLFKKKKTIPAQFKLTGKDIERVCKIVPINAKIQLQAQNQEVLCCESGRNFIIQDEPNKALNNKPKDEENYASPSVNNNSKGSKSENGSQHEDTPVCIVTKDRMKSDNPAPDNIHIEKFPSGRSSGIRNGFNSK